MSIKNQVEITLTQRFVMTENGINGTGITIQFFDDDQNVEIYYHTPEITGIDHVEFDRSNMNDEQATDLSVRAVCAIMSGHTGEVLTNLVNAMKVDVMNPSEYDAIAEAVISNLIERHRCDGFFIHNDSETRFIKIRTTLTSIVLECATTESDQVYAEEFTGDCFEILLKTAETALDDQIAMTDIEGGRDVR